MALRSGFRAEIGHFRDVPMWVNGKNGRQADGRMVVSWGGWALICGDRNERLSQWSGRHEIGTS